MEARHHEKAQACSHAKIREGAKPLAMKSTRQDSNNSEVQRIPEVQRMQSEVPEGAMGSAEGAIAPSAPVWLRA